MRQQRRIRINTQTKKPRTVHPIALVFGPDGWAVLDQSAPESPIPLSKCGDVNISANHF